MQLVDAHGHLNADRFAGDVEAVLDRARAAGLARILVPGWNLRSSERALDLVAAHPWLDAAVGIHPHDAARAGAGEFAEVERFARDPRVLAIGETGLDADRGFSPWADQVENLRRHLDLALATRKPAILHCRSRPGERDAHDALADELRRAGFGGPRARAAFGERPGAVVHSFSGPPDYAAAMLGLGCALSFSGLVFRAGEEPSADAARLPGPDRLLVETDSPFLVPPGGPRGRNEPAAVAITARWLARIRGEDGDPAAFGKRLVAAYDRLLPRPA